MIRRSLSEPLTLQVGTTSRPRLLAALESGGVQLNASARTLLDDAAFDRPTPQSVTVVQRSLKELGLPAGAALPLIFEAAQDHGLDLCPADTGPYLRLAWRTQPNAPDAIMSNGRAPTGSLTVAAASPARGRRLPQGLLPPRHRSHPVAARLPLRPHVRLGPRGQLRVRAVPSRSRWRRCPRLSRGVALIMGSGAPTSAPPRRPCDADADGERLFAVWAAGGWPGPGSRPSRRRTTT